MKIDGRSDFLEKGQVELIEGVFITINGLPHGFGEEMKKLLPSPEPPRRPIRGPDGQVRKKPGTNIIETEANEEDPEYIKKTRETVFRQGAWIIYYGTRSEEKLQWNVDPASMATDKFCDAINKELKDAGIGQGRTATLIAEICTISGMMKDKIEEAKDTFLSEGVSEE